MDEKEIQKARNDANNAEVAKAAGKVYLTAQGGALGNAVANSKIYDKVGDAAGKAITNANKIVPGMQKQMNALAESGAAKTVSDATDLAAQADVNASKEANHANNRIPKKGPETLEPEEESSVHYRPSNKDQYQDFEGDSDEKKSVDISLKQIKKVAIISSVAVFAFFIVLFVFWMTMSGESSNVLSRGEYIYFYNNRDSNDPEFKDYFYDEDAVKKIMEQEKNLIDRVDQIYDYYHVYDNHPDVGVWPKLLWENPEWNGRNYESLDATKAHVMSTLYLEYTPQTFSESIDSEETNFEDENEKAYNLCGEDYCMEGKLVEEYYYTPNAMRMILEEKGKDQAADRDIADIYRKDKDDPRRLIRNVMVFKPTCFLADCAGDRIDTEYRSSCLSKEDEINNNLTDYEIMSFYHMILKFSLIDNVTSYLERNFWDCKSHIDPSTPIGIFARTLVSPKEDGLRHDYDIARYFMNEVVDVCAYYEWMIEDDYLDEKYRLNEEFKTINTENYSEMLKKYKVEYAKEVIKAVDLGDKSDPISVTDGSMQDIYSSSGTGITVRDDENGGKIIGTYPIDLYVQGVLAREVGGYYGNREKLGASIDQVKEGWKAMAIAIRSYALAKTNGGTRPIGNTAKDQVFSEDNLVTSKADTPAALVMRLAAHETSELILMANKKFFSAEYDSYNKDNVHCDNKFCYSDYLVKGSSKSIHHWVRIPASWLSMANGGHGRGMSQLGVYYLASIGWSYSMMLNYFYGDQVYLYYYDTFDVSTEEEMYSNIQYGGNTDYQGEAILGCDYGLEIPLRTTGLTNYDVYGFVGLLCKKNGGRVHGKTCTSQNMNDLPSTKNAAIIEWYNFMYGTGPYGTGYNNIIDNNDLAYLTDKEKIIEQTTEEEIYQVEDVVAEPYNIFGTYDGVYTDNKIIDNARSMVGMKASELGYYFNTNIAWSASFVSFIFKTTSDNDFEYRANSVRDWLNYFENTNTFYHSDYWSNEINNPYYFKSFYSVNDVGGVEVGDLVFFFDNKCEYTGNGIESGTDYLMCYKHMGIVSNVTDKMITYVHGNTEACGSNGICETSIDKNSSYIVGYGKY